MRKPTWRKPLVIETRGNMTIVYFGDNEWSHEDAGAYERGNWAALDVKIRVRNTWDWLCGFFDFITNRCQL